MFVFLQRKLDNLRLVLRSERRVLRLVSRDLRKELKFHEKENSQHNKLENELPRFNKETVFALEKGDLILLGDDQNNLFKSLREVMVFNSRTINDIRKIEQEMPHASLSADSKEFVTTIIHASVGSIKDQLNTTLANLVGMESLTVSAFKLLDIESQERDAQGKFLMLSKDTNAWKKQTSLLRSELKKPRNDFKKLFGGTPTSSPFVTTLKSIEKKLIDDTQEIIILLNELHNDIKKVREGVKTLDESPKEGGLGFPDKDDQLKKLAQKLEDDYKTQLNHLINEIRQIMSNVDHLPLAA